jgi:hypothetical protein
LSEKPRQKTQAKILLLCKDSRKTQKRPQQQRRRGRKIKEEKPREQRNETEEQIKANVERTGRRRRRQTQGR